MPASSSGKHAVTNTALFGAFVSRYSNLPTDDPLRVAGRTFVLTLSLSLGPAILPVLTAKRFRNGRLSRLAKILRNELGPSGFAFAMTVAIGGAAALDRLWQWVDSDSDDCYDARRIQYTLAQDCARKLRECSRKLALRPAQKTFLTSSLTSLVAIFLMQSRRRSAQPLRASIPFTIPLTKPKKTAAGRTSATLDLTLMLLVRALDALVQRDFVRRAEDHSNLKGKQKEGALSIHDVRARAARMTDKLDAFVFWLASSRIMWCFFYEPERLPRSYVKWIGALANIDKRLLEALRYRRHGTWTYGKDAPNNRLLSGLSADLGYPPSWGDASYLPAFGGPVANEAWSRFGVQGRDGVGGVPCELVHGNAGRVFGRVGNSCSASIAIRGLMGFVEALAIYGPVHFLPLLLTKPRSLTSLAVLRTTCIAVLRSSLFLSTFISSIWSAVCFTRTLVIARLFPRLSHNFYDGPYGGVLAGCLACGASIWIEQGRRRGEMALYVLPRALRATISDRWLRSGSMGVKAIEGLAFALSLATILTASRHGPESLRGLSRWTMMFILEGPKADFFKWARVPGAKEMRQIRC